MPRLVISPCRRARNLRRVGPSVPRSSASTRSSAASPGSRELDEVDAVLAVVVVRIAEPAGAAGDGSGGLGRRRARAQSRCARSSADDQVFEAALARVGRHASDLLQVFDFGSCSQGRSRRAAPPRHLVRQVRRRFAHVELPVTTSQRSGGCGYSRRKFNLRSSDGSLRRSGSRRFLEQDTMLALLFEGQEGTAFKNALRRPCQVGWPWSLKPEAVNSLPEFNSGTEPSVRVAQL